MHRRASFLRARRCSVRSRHLPHLQHPWLVRVALELPLPVLPLPELPAVAARLAPAVLRWASGPALGLPAVEPPAVLSWELALRNRYTRRT